MAPDPSHLALVKYFGYAAAAAVVCCGGFVFVLSRFGLVSFGRAPVPRATREDADETGEEERSAKKRRHARDGCGDEGCRQRLENTRGEVTELKTKVYDTLTPKVSSLETSVALIAQSVGNMEKSNEKAIQSLAHSVGEIKKPVQELHLALIQGKVKIET